MQGILKAIQNIEIVSKIKIKTQMKTDKSTVARSAWHKRHEDKTHYCQNKISSVRPVRINLFGRISKVFYYTATRPNTNSSS